MTLKDKIKELCTKQGINLPKLEEALGFGNGTIVKWDKSSPSLSKVMKVADYFGVTVAELLGENEQKNKPTTINGDELSEAERDFILLLRSIPEQERDMVAEMIRAALRSKGLL